MVWVLLAAKWHGSGQEPCRQHLSWAGGWIFFAFTTCVWFRREQEIMSFAWQERRAQKSLWSSLSVWAECRNFIMMRSEDWQGTKDCLWLAVVRNPFQCCVILRMWCWGFSWCWNGLTGLQQLFQLKDCFVMWSYSTCLTHCHTLFQSVFICLNFLATYIWCSHTKLILYFRFLGIFKEIHRLRIPS